MTDIPSPYRGLTPYTEADAAYFFGRTQESANLAANLEVARLTIFYGPSGVGKSSVLRAGVIHTLQQRAQENFAASGRPEIIPVYFNRWQSEPLQGLIQAILDAVQPFLWQQHNTEITIEDLRLTKLLITLSSQTNSELLLVLDQFEEYFLYHPDDREPWTFAYELVQAVNNVNVRCNFLLSVREDALGRLDHFKGQIPFLLDNRLSIEHLSRAAGREAIVRPLGQYNVDHGAQYIIEPDLVESLLDQVGRGKVALSRQGASVSEAERGRIEAPYLQLVLTRLWEQEKSLQSTELRKITLDALGGAESIVSNYLHDTMMSMSDVEQALAARFFDRLVTLGGAKIALTLVELAYYAGADIAMVQPVVERLEQQRLLRSVQSAMGVTQYEIFHDVLGQALLDWQQRYQAAQAEAEQLAAAEQRTREARNRAEQLGEINRMGQFIAETLDLDQIYAQIGQTIQAVLPGISDLFIELYDAKQESLQIVYGIQDGQPLDSATLPKSPSVPQELLQSDASLARLSSSPDNLAMPDVESENTGNGNGLVSNKAAAYVPMAARGEIVGMLHVRSKILQRFSPIDLEFLTLLANTAAIFIQNAILFKNLQQSNRRAQEELVERKQAEATIRSHLSAMETSNDGIAILDADRTFIYLNAAFATLYGYQKPEQLLGQSWSLLYPETEQQRIAEDIIPELTRSRKWRGKATGKRLNGTFFQQEISLVLTETDEITAVVHDITEQRDVEEALQRSKKLESLGVLAGGIAHDFNYLLAGMLGQLSLAKAKLSVDNPAYRHVENVITSATHAADLTHQLLTYASKGNFQVARLNINSLILANTSLLETVVPKQVQLSLDLSLELADIEADISQIQQMIINLLLNASEAIGDKPGQVTIHSSMFKITEQMSTENHYIGTDKLSPGTYVSLVVTDNGMGLHKNVIDQIFDPPISTKGQERGLGLSAALGIIRAHKGGLQVESQVGHGSTFKVFLPAIIEPP